ncbi:heterokaryon incompatibility protein-domain-containing protein [Immersiella caudata]|uniref:Heterokaryon incompatibility protein-domain-containing protein n=1 Tax=Immersiella caudata TaxID=314043 RepID=A0AA39WSJ0_9PEZI|nr:heterokaryon incompatibility protein-domain-containing protein [Immersiella caudata]
MKLINTATLELKEFPEERAPPYAILSHTWGDEEVTFQDMRGPIANRQSKKGYDKIVRTCEEAKSNGLGYAWVDTCCIDKSSSAELSESINSMFRWYAKAKVCYAYLVDVPDVPLKRSVWFTRGWTLQELLAPRKLEFFDMEWSSIGTREMRSAEITTATGIKEAYLHPKPTKSGSGSRKEYHEVVQEMLAEASIAQRMSWAANRKTTRVEDVAYSLLGIFGINMPLLYGEGKGAFIRLQEAVLEKVYDDQSIFAWDQPCGRDHNNRMLAESPDSFDGCGTISLCRMHGYDPGLSLTNKGIRLNIPIFGRGELHAILRCQREDDPLTLVAVPIAAYDADVFVRRPGKIRFMAQSAWPRLPVKSIYLSMERRGARAAWDRPSVKIRANPEYFSIEDDTVSEHDLGIGYEPLLADQEPSPSNSRRRIRAATLVIKTTLTNAKLGCNIETHEVLGFERTAPLITAQVRPPFLMRRIEASQASDAPKVSIELNDHIVLSRDKVIYTTIQTNDIFGRTIYTVDINVSSSRLLVLWFLIKNQIPLIRSLQLSWRLQALWVGVKVIRQHLTSADIPDITSFEVAFLFVYALLYLHAMWPYALVASHLLPNFIRSGAIALSSLLTRAAATTTDVLLAKVAREMTPEIFSLYFLVLVISMWMATITQKRTTSMGTRILRLCPLLFASRPLLNGAFFLCRDDHERLLLQYFLLSLLGLVWFGVSRMMTLDMGWYSVADMTGLFALYLVRMVGVGSLLCYLAAATGWMPVWRWAVNAMTVVTLLAHGAYLMVCLLLPPAMVVQLWD